MKLDFLNECSELINNRINEIFDQQSSPEILKKAMLYSITAGGKRLRPALTMQFYKALGGKYEDILDLACAVEMIHTYSLIHDDLPCMDDDDTRRGKPSCHIAFGEDIALLAGDALLTLAFETASSNKGDANRVLKSVNILSKAAGMCGMCAGQTLDLESEDKQITADNLKEIHKGKTVAMIKVCAQIACAMTDADEDTLKHYERYCDDIGLAFQIQDDILDVVGDYKKLGKPINSDSDNNKNTYVSFYGIEKCRKYVEELTNDAMESVCQLDEDENLRELAIFLAKRDH